MIAPTVQIGPLESHVHIKCSHPRCDGRDAKWFFPQTQNRPGGPLYSCSVHVARFLEIILRDLPIDVLAQKTRDAA